MELALVEICVSKILQEQFPDKSKDSTERLQAQSVEVPFVTRPCLHKTIIKLKQNKLSNNKVKTNTIV